MKVHFTVFGQLDASFKRDVHFIPRKGEVVVVHKERQSLKYTVTSVFHVYDDREWYASRDDFGDHVHVTLEPTESV